MQYIDEIFYDSFDDLTSNDYINCTFDGVDFEDISGCRFDNCTFKACNFSASRVSESAFLNCYFRFSKFFSTVFTDCKTTGSSFENTDISMIDIIHGDWSLTDLSHQNFSNKKFEKVNFFGSDFSFSNLNQCVIKDCEFLQSRLINATAYKADIRTSKFDGNISQLQIRNTKIDLEQAILIANGHGGNYTP